MKMRTAALIAILAAGFPFLLSDALPYPTVTATVDAGAEITVELWIQNQMDWTNAQAGRYALTRTGGTYTGRLWPYNPAASTFVAFCMEPQQDIALHRAYTWSLGPLNGGMVANVGLLSAEKMRLLRRLFGAQYPVFGASRDALTLAALQVAIWEIVRETAVGASGALNLNLSQGAIQFRNGSVANLLETAQRMLTRLGEAGFESTNLRSLFNATEQDLIVQIP